MRHAKRRADANRAHFNRAAVGKGNRGRSAARFRNAARDIQSINSGRCDLGDGKDIASASRAAVDVDQPGKGGGSIIITTDGIGIIITII